MKEPGSQRGRQGHLGTTSPAPSCWEVNLDQPMGEGAASQAPASQMCACSVLALAGLFLCCAGTEGFSLGACIRLAWTGVAGGVGRVPATPFSSHAPGPGGPHRAGAEGWARPTILQTSHPGHSAKLPLCLQQGIMKMNLSFS